MSSTSEIINFVDLFLLCDNLRALHERLVEWKLVPRAEDFPCPRCGNPFSLETSTPQADHLLWVCQAYVSTRKQKRKPCGNTQSYRTGTLFGLSELSLAQIMCFAHLWVERCRLRFICRELEIESIDIAVMFAATCREIVLDSMIETTVELGGENVVVEILENPCRRRTNSESDVVNELWVYAGWEKSTGRVFMVLVEKRSPELLLGVIKKWILPGTTVVADFWRTYKCLSSEGYRQLAADHSITFDFRNSNRKKTDAAGDLAVHLFRKQCRLLKLDPTVEFYRLAGLMYDPRRPCTVTVEPDMTGIMEEVEYQDNRLLSFRHFIGEL